MATHTVTNLDPVEVGMFDNVCEDASIAFLAADLYAKGTILGKKTTSADSYIGTPTGTGTRVVTLTARAGRSLQVGAYSLLYGDVTAGAGPVTLTAPDGRTETATAAATGAMQFEDLGVVLTIGATGTIYNDADVVAFTVAAPSGLPVYGPYVSSGANGLNVPSAVLLSALEASGAGNIYARPCISGHVNLRTLIIDTGGSVGPDVIQQLRDYGILARTTTDLAELDNQP